MNLKTMLSAAVAALALSSTLALAEPTAATGSETKPAATSTDTASKKAAKAAKKAAKAEKSKQCSAEADAKKLHGKARKEFRKTCMKADAKPAAM